MTAVTFFAKRSLVAGHDLDDEISLDLEATIETTPFSRKPKIEMNESLDGHREVLRYHAIRTMTVHLAPSSGATLDAVIEFLDSVEAGESFTFDAYGSVAIPDDPVTATLQEGGYDPSRFASVGAGGKTDYVTISFSVRIRLP